MNLCELYVIEGEAENKEEAIKLTSEVLSANGAVKKGFWESCVEREKNYPTGLTEYCPVAIPHTTKDFVNKDAICVLKLKNPVKFASMEDWEKEIDIKTVFNLAFLDDAEHLVLITKIIRGLKKPEFIESLTNLPVDELKKYLETEILFNEG